MLLPKSLVINFFLSKFWRDISFLGSRTTSCKFQFQGNFLVESKNVINFYYTNQWVIKSWGKRMENISRFVSISMWIAANISRQQRWATTTRRENVLRKRNNGEWSFKCFRTFIGGNPSCKQIRKQTKTYTI